MPLQYPYPENGWSTGKMRKRGQKPEGEYDVAMDIQRRGQPQIGQPEFEQAGALAARGGSTTARAEVVKGARALSPDVIEQQKSQITAMGNHWISGLVDWNKFNKEVKYHGWEILAAPIDFAPTPGGVVTSPKTFLMQWSKQTFQEAKEKHEKRVVERKNFMMLKDPNGRVYEVPLDNQEE
jgi:hypothetical protein